MTTPLGRLNLSARLRGNWLLLLAALVPFLLVLPWQLQLGPPVGADDYGQYLSHARALVEGRSYTDIGYIRTRYALHIGPAAEPPGLPLTLVPIVVVFGESRIALRILMTVTAIAVAWLGARYVSQRSDSAVAVAVAIQTGVALQAEHAVYGIGADLGFMALLWVVLLVADCEGPWSRQRTVGVAVAGAAATLYRTAAAPLGLALVVYGALRPRGQRRAPIIVGLLVLGVFATMMVVMRQLGADADANTAPGLAPGLLASDLTRSPADVLHLLAGRAVYFRTGLSTALTRPFGMAPLNTLYHVIAASIAGVGAVVWLRREWRSLTAIFAAGYVLMLSVAPVIDRRYVWPLFPLIGYWLVEGIAIVVSASRRAVARKDPLGRRGAPWTQYRSWAAACLTVVMLVSLASAARNRPRRALEDHSDAQRLFTHLKSLAPVDSLRVLFFSPRALTWNTRIPAMGSFNASPSEVIAELQRKRISHVVVGDLGFQRARDLALRAAIAAYPAQFSLLYSNASFSVYRFSPSADSR